MAGKPWTGRETQRAYEESKAERTALFRAVDRLRQDVWIDRAIMAAIAAGAFGKPVLGMLGIVLP